MRGVRSLPDAQVLFRMTGARVAALVDNDPHSEVQGLWNAPDAELRKLSDRKSNHEVVHMARLIAAAREAEVRIEPFSIPTRDILGLLDADAVNRALLELGRQAREVYPGYEVALRAAGGKTGRDLDDFLARRYGLTKDPELFELASDLMRRGNNLPVEPTRLLDDLERLALEVDHRP